MRRKSVVVILAVLMLAITGCADNKSESTVNNVEQGEAATDTETKESGEQIQDAEKEKSDVDSAVKADDSGKKIDVHDKDGNVSVSYTVPSGYYLLDKMGNLGVEEFDLTYDNGEFVGMQSYIAKKDSLKSVNICGASHEALPVTKGVDLDKIIATVESAQGNVYDIMYYGNNKYRAYNADDYGIHIHFIIRGWITDDVADKEPWTESEVLDLVINYY